MFLIVFSLQIIVNMNYEPYNNYFRLHELPNEILLAIMVQLTANSLLDMSRVCSRFRSVAKDAFSKKYTGKSLGRYYELKIFCEYEYEEYIRFRPFFRTFGQNMIAIEVHFFDESPIARNHWLYKLIQNYCTSLARIRIYSGDQLDLMRIIGSAPKETLTHLRLNGVKFLNNSWSYINYPSLECFEAHHSMDRVVLTTFLRNNRQIKALDFSYCRFEFDVFQLLNGQMNELTSLCIHDYTPMSGDRFDIIQLEALESFELCIDPDTTLAILKGISKGCKKLSCLLMKENSHHHLSWDDNCIQAVCNLTNLETLTICSSSLGAFRLKKIVSSLPKLTSLSLQHFYDEADVNQNIPEVVDFCSKLIELDIEICGDPPEITIDFLKQIAETTQNSTLKVKLDRNLKLISYQGEVRNDDAIIYWDGYDPTFNKSSINLLDLSDACLVRIAGFLDLDSQCELFNTCKRTRKSVSEYISNHVFYASLNMDDRIFQDLGEHIRYMNIDITVVNTDHNDDDDVDVIESWSRVNQNCSKVTELTVTTIFYVLDDVRNIPNLRWPNLRKLIFSTPYPVTSRVLRSFECPKLAHLEVRSFAGEYEAFEENHWKLEDAYGNLKILKVSDSFSVPQPK